MKIEFSRELNPFRRGPLNELPVLLSSSSIRSEFAGFCRLPINDFHPEVLQILLAAIEKKEAETQRKAQLESNNHHAVSAIRRSDTSPLLLLELSTDKAEAAFKEIERLTQIGWNYEKWGNLPTSFITADSAWAIGLTPENPNDLNDQSIFIQKPKDQEGVELIIDNLRKASLRGCHLQSVSAVCRVVIQEDGTPLYQHGLIVVDYGKLNPYFDWQKLEKLMKKNGRFAGGLSTKDLFAAHIEDLVKTDGDDYIRIQLIEGKQQHNKTVPPWEEFCKNQQIYYLSRDASNIEQLIAMSVGLIPQG